MQYTYQGKRQKDKGKSMIRPTVPEDTAPLVKLAEGTNVFKPHEIVALEEVLDDFHATIEKDGHRSVTFEKDGQILGFAYFAPAAMTDRTWYLYWIAVTKQTQAKGIGTQLLHYSEKEIQKAGGRLYLIETSSLPAYEQTRKFYLKHGYEQHAVIADFYADGDSMVIFRKHLKNV
jgi:GNAT superfamily N-acetyltransferase